MPKLKRSRNNLLAGLFVLAAILGLTAAIIILSGGAAIFNARSYTIVFSPDVGVAGLREGSPVLAAGRPIGQVDRVVPVVNNGRVTTTNRATIAIDDDITLRQGAVAQLQTPLLGTLSSINFTTFGTGDELSPDDPITAQIAGSQLLASAGIGDEQTAAVRATINAAQQAAERLQRIAERIDQNVIPAFTQTVTDANNRAPDWFDTVSRILDNAESVTADGQQLADDLAVRVEELERLTASAQTVIDQAGPDITNAADTIDTIATDLTTTRQNLDTFIEGLNRDILTQATALLETGNDTADNARAVVERIETTLATAEPTIDRAIADTAITTRELRFMAAELRRSPWRLIYRPDTQELEYELLYEAARAYAQAVTELRVTTEALAALEQHETPDANRISTHLEALDAAMQSLKRMERAFVNELLDTPQTDDSNNDE